MADELTHKDPGAELTQAEYITSDGTGHVFESQAQGDILYATSTTVLSRLGKDANATRALTNTGTNNNPAWAQVTLTTGVTGTLPVANGGTGATTLTDKAVLISQDSGTDTVGSVAITSSGQIIIGGSSGPAAATLTAGAGIDITNGDGSITIVGETASDSNAGIAELATTAEINTGDDTGRVITPKALADSALGERVIQMVCVDFATALTTGSKFYFHVPSTLNGMNIVDVHAETLGDPSGSTIIIDLHNVTQSDASVLSGKLTIGIGYFGSDESGGSVTIDTGEDLLATNDVLRVDIDQIGSGDPGTGLIVTLICRLP
jgi:hypothetical protein